MQDMTKEEIDQLLRLDESPDVKAFRTMLKDITDSNLEDAMNVSHKEAAYRLQLLDMGKGIQDALAAFDDAVDFAHAKRKELNENQGETPEPPIGEQEGGVS